MIKSLSFPKYFTSLYDGPSQYYSHPCYIIFTLYFIVVSIILGISLIYPSFTNDIVQTEFESVFLTNKIGLFKTRPAQVTDPRESGSRFWKYFVRNSDKANEGVEFDIPTFDVTKLVNQIDVRAKNLKCEEINDQKLVYARFYFTNQNSKVDIPCNNTSEGS